MSSVDEDALRAEARTWAEEQYAKQVEDEIAAIANRRFTWMLNNARGAEREANAAKARERQEVKLLRQARRAWRKRFGREIAGRLELRARYALLGESSGGRVWLFSDTSAQRGARAYLEQDPYLRVTSKVDIAGIELAKHVAENAHVEALDPPLSVFAELVAEREAQRLEKRKRKEERAAERRQREREKALFGVELGDDGAA